MDSFDLNASAKRIASNKLAHSVVDNLYQDDASLSRFGSYLTIEQSGSSSTGTIAASASSGRRASVVDPPKRENWEPYPDTRRTMLSNMNSSIAYPSSGSNNSAGSSSCTDRSSAAFNFSSATGAHLSYHSKLPRSTPFIPEESEIDQLRRELEDATKKLIQLEVSSRQQPSPHQRQWPDSTLLTSPMSEYSTSTAQSSISGISELKSPVSLSASQTVGYNQWRSVQSSGFYTDPSDSATQNSWDRTTAGRTSISQSSSPSIGLTPYNPRMSNAPAHGEATSGTVPAAPLNYRRMLERNATCDWASLLGRILVDNDQQTSIFLQQKLKVANAEQKSEIIAAITHSAYALMRNRFGNFLLQRCLEYGDDLEIARIASIMVGRINALAMDQFGCHVVQKALDCVNWTTKVCIIEEMCVNIQAGVTDRYACHVWQKLFELRWDSSALNIPRFMDKVNKDLKGKWTTVALAETGSLVVQNIFENCILEEKRSCIEEVISNLDTIIRGQWGNWVIQHMVEHACEPYRTEVINKVIAQAPVYSVDQFASKAMEKMLKMGDVLIIQKFLDKVVEKSGDRPRIPLIDIASDAHGNYLVQYILQGGSTAQKETVAAQIKKHIVSLRGSKWGSKCAWLIDKNRSTPRRDSKQRGS